MDMEAVRRNFDDDKITAVFIRHTRMPEGYLVGTVYSDDLEVAERVAWEIDGWSQSWTVDFDHIENAPDWLEEPVEEGEFGKYIAGKCWFISYEEGAFGAGDVPVLVINDSDYPLEELD